MKKKIFYIDPQSMNNLSEYDYSVTKEIDCEIIGNFRINRYLSAKVSLNPRYDTTIILSDGTKPKFQFKEFISLGFNYIL